MPEARRFEPVVAIGRTYDEILARLEEAVVRPDIAAQAAARMAAVADHSWEHRFRELERVLAPYVAPATPPAPVETRS
jgi:hypothetical protein